jgi:predicted GNAT family N-acyltransferase
VIVRPARLDEILALRHAVLRPGRPLETACFDGDDDPTTVHVGAFDGDHRLVGCATLMRRAFEAEDAGQLRGMATAPNDVRQGVGRGVVRFVEETLAPQWNVSLFWCNARIGARDFYVRLGWIVVSQVFDIPDVGPHVRMIRDVHQRCRELGSLSPRFLT